MCLQMWWSDEWTDRTQQTLEVNSNWLYLHYNLQILNTTIALWKSQSQETYLTKDDCQLGG